MRLTRDTMPPASQPLVSILVPAFNAQRWIADTIRSALAQTWPRKEIIVVDDGSVDRTLSVARHFESRDVHVVTGDNAGAAAARNRAYDLCQGDYIQWLDADDLLAPDKIERQLSALREGDTDRALPCSAWGSFSYRPRRATFRPTRLWSDLSPADWLVIKMNDHSFMQTSTWLTSRALAQAAGPWDPSISFDDDGEYFCRVLVASAGTRFVPESKVYYRNAATGRLSHIGSSEAKIRSLLRSMRVHIASLRALEDSPRVEDACVRYIESWAAYCDPSRRDLLAEFESMAAELGREFTPPRIRPKYRWMSPLVGTSTAWKAQTSLPSYKHALAAVWDKAMAAVEDRLGLAGSSL